MRDQLGISYVVIALLCFADALGAEQVVVYSSVKEVIAEPLAERFEKETGTAVRLVSANTQRNSKELFDHLIAGKKDSLADVFWSRDSVDAIVLKAKGLSAPYESPNAKNLPKLYSDPEHYWTGFPAHARIIIYNKNLFTDREEIPTSIFDMINPRFNGKACIANPLFGTTSMHAAALFQVLGRDMAEAFFNTLKTNKVTIVSSNNEVGIRVAAGDFAFGIEDTDDYNAAFRQGKLVGVVFPDQQAFGTLVIPNALILMSHGRHLKQGKRFIDFLLRPEIRELLAAGEVSQSPIQTGTPMPEGIPSLYNIKAMQIDYSKLISQSKELSRGFLKEWLDSQK